MLGRIQVNHSRHQDVGVLSREGNKGVCYSPSVFSWSAYLKALCSSSAWLHRLSPFSTSAAQSHRCWLQCCAITCFLRSFSSSYVKYCISMGWNTWNRPHYITHIKQSIIMIETERQRVEQNILFAGTVMIWREGYC